ncbi:hypothetical protein N7462_000522 [Penicillium macrosclerotiorum]|uniref:uncharacterized protein n=1 Tax=Penicillium macrosclerotiorum TaxID=303699 RepID=UPI0025495C03|nr:uncharacterized protein N7462_000522 [Penicillium macrosclerotiorum]KAJ5698517.1 hypothetical protein N7462_000522 [Penicillium macrosclerotiorum]
MSRCIRARQALVARPKPEKVGRGHDDSVDVYNMMFGGWNQPRAGRIKDANADSVVQNRVTTTSLAPTRAMGDRDMCNLQMLTDLAI